MNMNNPYEENLQKPLEKYGRDITFYSLFNFFAILCLKIPK